ncbi:MAG: GNAT family N-acetyltransferase [Micromonosporaceae bacterium]
MQIDRLPATPEAYRSWYELTKVAMAADVPDLPPRTHTAIVAGLTVGWPGNRDEHWIAHDGDTLLGFAELSFPVYDNLDNASAEIVVHPDHRRLGVGTGLLTRVVERIRAEGRKRLVLTAREPLPGSGVRRSEAGARFAERHRAHRALVEVGRRLELSDVDATRLDASLAEAWSHAAGYSLLTWTDRTPDDAVADIAALDSSFLDEAPLGDLAWEPEKVDVARIRAAEAAIVARGYKRRHVAARHDATGRVVAWTTLGLVPEYPEHGWQMITLVSPAHRGHRLGTVIKLENFAAVRREWAGLRRIDTYNAEVNDHMVAINDLMGFRPMDRSVDWQLDL